MYLLRHFSVLACTALLILAGCATSAESEMKRQAAEADIAKILSMPLDAVEFGATKRCLRDSQFRNFRVLDDQRILFEGRRNEQWINTLRTRCPDLRWGDVLVMRRFSGSRMCDADRFEVADWFAWPWYRRWPWQWGPGWGTGRLCSLGKFQPVTDDQVAQIEAVLRRR